MLLFILLFIFIIAICALKTGGAQKKPTFRDFCFPQRFKLQQQQKSLGRYFTPEKIKKRGGANTLIVFHKIGSGKTCTAIQIANNFVFKNAKPLFIMPASLIPNFLDETEGPCGADLKSFETRSYNKLLTDKPKNISIIIIDEFQNIINQKGSFFKAIIDLIERNPTIPVVLLSGTPIFDNAGEFKSILRLLRFSFSQGLESEGDPNNNSDLKEFFRGRISYYAGAPKFTFPQIKTKILKCMMSPFQSKWYIAEVEAEMKKNRIHLNEVSNDFYIKSRQKANIAFGNKPTINTAALSADLQKYSTKFYHLFKKLKQGRLSFVYTNFTNKYGIQTLTNLLEHRGYKNFHKHGPGPRTFAIWSGDETQTQKKKIKSTFNDTANNDASQIQIIIGSSAIKEGVSLYRIDSVHILDMYWNYSRLEQIYGRAIRFCSHKLLPAKDRKVRLYLYTSFSLLRNEKDSLLRNDSNRDEKEKKSIDALMLDIAEKKRIENKKYINFFIKNAIESQK